MRLNLLAVCTAALGWAANTAAPSKPTFTKDVAPILNQRCVECHRQGEAAPMAFTSYKDVRPWARAIKEKVVSRAMPPWLADARYGHFDNERRLKQPEIDTVAAWVDQGAPEGDPKFLPKPPIFEQGWAVGKPDVVFELPQAVAVQPSGVIPYQYYTVPTGFKEDTWVQAAEIRPGNRAVVHHIIVFIQPQGAKEGSPTGREKLSGFAPGEQPKVYPAGTAKLIPAGSNLVFQVHYTPNGTAATDRSYIGLLFAKQPVTRRALTGTALNTKFTIPPGDGNHEVQSSWEAKEDVRIVDLMPHMHLRGKDFTYTAVYPNGSREIVLSVPRYDFNWQLLYQFAEPLRLPKGSRLECVAHFDNSSNNKHNPDPNKEVKWGPQTWEEMMIGWFDYTTEAELNAKAR
ncbi:MAG: thiol-disulfide isomerase [Acidobacteriia bacterium]|nr:thiol-disulfide isomerase [Terriglobia bacterium]